MKILIADDEGLARSTLRSMLQELPLCSLDGVSLELLEEATNGEEMVELVQRHTPDIVFVDIKMPKLNGLEAIKKAKIGAPDTRWFIVTGFSEFSYAQEALRMSVSDYLLKPVDPEEVRKAITGVIGERRKRLITLNQQFERDIAALFHGLSSIKQEDRDSLLMKGHFVGAIFYIDSCLTETEKAQRQSDFLRDVRAASNALLADEIKLANFALPGGEIALIGAWRAVPGEHHCYRYLHLVERILPNYHDQHFCITMLQTPVCRSYDELSERLNWLQRFSALRAVYGIGKKLHIKELMYYMAHPHLVEISQLLEKVSFYHREKMYVQYMHALDILLKTFSDEKKVDYGTKKCVAAFLSHTFPCQIVPEQTIAEWRRMLQNSGEQMLLAQPKKEHVDLLAQVILFIEQNYQADIGIAQIAEMLHVTPNYLSTIFHKRFGVTFMKYLTKIRMLRAKELLANPEMQVQQVAEQVGYTSVRHFTKVFTAFFGCYPSDLLKKRH